MAEIKNKQKLSMKMAAAFLLQLVIVTIVMSIVAINISYQSVANLSSLELENITKHTASLVNAGMIQKWIKNGTDREYDTIMNELIGIKEISSKIDYIYVFVPEVIDGIYTGKATYIFDVQIEKDEHGDFCNFGDVSIDTNSVDIVNAMLRNGERTSVFTINDPEYGDMMSVYEAITLPESGTLCAIAGADVHLHTIYSATAKLAAQVIISMFILIALFSIAITHFITKAVVMPVKKLSESMRRFAADESHLDFVRVTGIQTHDEIQQMAEDFNSMARSMLAYANNLEHKTVIRERIKSDFDVSSQIRSTVSTDVHYPAFPERDDFDLCVSLRNTVHNKCSFCNYFLTDEDHLFIVVGENTGSSLGSMLVSMLASANIQSFAKMGYPPYRIATETNNQLCSLEKTDKGLTVGIVIAQIDLRHGVMKYVNAGMPPILVKKTGDMFTRHTAPIQFNLGEMHGVSFTEETIALCQGNTVIFTSPGVSEMRNQRGVLFTEERLLSSVNEICGTTYELDRFVSELEDRLEKFRGDEPVRDDTTIAAFRYFG